MIWPPTASSVTPYAAEKWNDTWNLTDTGVGSQYLYGLHGVVEVAPPAGSGMPTNSFINVAIEIGWRAQAGRYYRVQWSDELAPATWFDLSGLVRGGSSTATNYFYDTTRRAPKRFYRVLALP